MERDRLFPESRRHGERRQAPGHLHADELRESRQQRRRSRKHRPGDPAGRGFPGRLALQSGKDAQPRLINLENLSGQGGPGHTGGQLQLLAVPQGGQVLTAPAVWINPGDSSTWVFVTNGSGSSGLKLTFPGGAPTLATLWQNTLRGFSPLVANNVLYFAGGNIIRALDPLTETCFGATRLMSAETTGKAPSSSTRRSTSRTNRRT